MKRRSTLVNDNSQESVAKCDRLSKCQETNEEKKQEKCENLATTKVKNEENINLISNKPKKRKQEDEEQPKKIRRTVRIEEKIVEENEVNKLKGLSKNECLCEDNFGKPVEQEESSCIKVAFKKIFGISRKSQDEEEGVHIMVEKWRMHKFQSPIELKHDESIHHDHFEPLEFHGHWDEGGNATFTNNGKTATLRFFDRELPILRGGPLHEDNYIFEQLHFHWSEDDTGGCEHIFEGKAYSMEAHIVHYNSKYKDFNEAHDKHDGLAVVAFFIEATDNEDNPCFNKLATAVQAIEKINTTTEVPSDCLTWIQEVAQCKGYYTYQGSLTTEPYTESVTWILYPTSIHVSRQQVAHFRNMKSTHCEKVKITNNVRPIQTHPENKKPDIYYARSHKKSE